MRTLSSRLLVLPVFLLPMGRLGDEPHYKPKEGATVRRTFTSKSADDLKRVTLKLGEESHSTEDVDAHQKVAVEMVVRDEFVSVAGTRVKKLERTYEKLSKARTMSSKSEKGENAKTTDETCDLADATVVFAWDPSKKEYARSFKSGEHDKELLKPLVWDMDYTAFLPDHAVEEGATWELDLADVRGALFQPGGDLDFHGEKPTPAVEKNLRAKVWDSISGKLTAKHAGKHEEDGHALLVIAFEGKVEAGGEIEGDAEARGPEHLAAKMQSSLEGRIVWDLTAGRARSFACTEDGSYALIERGKVKTKSGEDAELERTLEFDSRTEYDMKIADE